MNVDAITIVGDVFRNQHGTKILRSDYGVFTIKDHTDTLHLGERILPYMVRQNNFEHERETEFDVYVSDEHILSPTGEADGNYTSRTIGREPFIINEQHAAFIANVRTPDRAVIDIDTENTLITLSEIPVRNHYPSNNGHIVHLDKFNEFVETEHVERASLI